MEIGPILGILSIPRANSNPFVGGQNESFTEILSIAQRMNCIAYVFSPLDIDWAKTAVWGYRYNQKLPSGEWERHPFPMPSVIYNRIPNRTMEKREDIRKVLNLLRYKYGPRFFNPFFLDKWETHKILCNNKQTASFLPETRKLEDPNIIAKMLNRYESVYLKPTANSLGNEIIKMYKTDDGYHFIHQSLNHPLREGPVTSCSELVAGLPLAEDNAQYLVQQGITLAEFQARPFDLRLLVQKNRLGKWQRTGLAARIAGKGSITTHVFYGGTRFPAEEVIREAARYHGFSVESVKKQFKNIQSAIPRAIERAYNKFFGELEMDVGIDRQGKVWFFEANSKPFRFDEKIIRAKSLVRLIHYVRFLDTYAKPAQL